MSDMSENKVGRHAKPKPTGVSALRSAENQARGKSASKGGRIISLVKSFSESHPWAFPASGTARA